MRVMIIGQKWFGAEALKLCLAHAHIFVTAEARGKARHGALGYHPSLLPRRTGAG